MGDETAVVMIYNPNQSAYGPSFLLPGTRRINTSENADADRNRPQPYLYAAY